MKFKHKLPEFYVQNFQLNKIVRVFYVVASVVLIIIS